MCLTPSLLARSGLGSLGLQALAAMFAAQGASTFIVPSIVQCVGARLSLVLGGIIYTAYVLSFVVVTSTTGFLPRLVLFTMSSIIGFGSTLLWVSAWGRGVCVCVWGGVVGWSAA